MCMCLQCTYSTCVCMSAGLCVFLYYTICLCKKDSWLQHLTWGQWEVAAIWSALGESAGHPELLGPRQVARLTSPTHLQPTKRQIMRGRQLVDGPSVPPPPTPGTLSVPTELFSKVSSSVVVVQFIWLCAEFPFNGRAIIQYNLFLHSHSGMCFELLPEVTNMNQVMSLHVKQRLQITALCTELCGYTPQPTDGSVSKQTWRVQLLSASDICIKLQHVWIHCQTCGGLYYFITF